MFPLSSVVKQTLGLQPVLRTDSERSVWSFIHEEQQQQVRLGDKRLNNIAALTYNADTSGRIFAILELCLDPQKKTWSALHRSILIVHTVLLYGSPNSVDTCIQMSMYIGRLLNYNSATFSTFSRGIDLGAPVRQASAGIVRLCALHVVRYGTGAMVCTCMHVCAAVCLLTSSPVPVPALPFSSPAPAPAPAPAPFSSPCPSAQPSTKSFPLMTTYARPALMPATRPVRTATAPMLAHLSL